MKLSTQHSVCRTLAPDSRPPVPFCTLIFAFCISLALCFLFPASAFSAPERVELKSQNVKAKQAALNTELGLIKPERIQDPEARKAITVILKVLRGKKAAE